MDNTNVVKLYQNDVAFKIGDTVWTYSYDRVERYRDNHLISVKFEIFIFSIDITNIIIQNDATFVVYGIENKMVDVEKIFDKKTYPNRLSVMKHLRQDLKM